jgi:hypothetical protein
VFAVRIQVGDGSYLFTIRSGWKPIEFDKGKSAIVVLSRDKLLAIIEPRASELSRFLESDDEADKVHLSTFPDYALVNCRKFNLVWKSYILNAQACS